MPFESYRNFYLDALIWKNWSIGGSTAGQRESVNFSSRKPKNSPHLLTLTLWENKFEVKHLLQIEIEYLHKTFYRFQTLQSKHILPRSVASLTLKCHEENLKRIAKIGFFEHNHHFLKIFQSISMILYSIIFRGRVWGWHYFFRKSLWYSIAWGQNVYHCRACSSEISLKIFE